MLGTASTTLEFSFGLISPVMSRGGWLLQPTVYLIFIRKVEAYTNDTLYKKDNDFPVPSWDVSDQTLPGRDIPAGDGKIANLFYSVVVSESY
jgi:hypothetical protein